MGFELSTKLTVTWCESIVPCNFYNTNYSVSFLSSNTAPQAPSIKSDFMKSTLANKTLYTTIMS